MAGCFSLNHQPMTKMMKVQSAPLSLAYPLNEKCSTKQRETSRSEDSAQQHTEHHKARQTTCELTQRSFMGLAKPRLATAWHALDCSFDSHGMMQARWVRGYEKTSMKALMVTLSLRLAVKSLQNQIAKIMASNILDFLIHGLYGELVGNKSGKCE